jgi:hypothetical protein
MRSTLTLSKSFALVIGSSVSIFCSVKAFLIVDSSFTSSFITLGIFCDAKIDEAKDEGCCGTDCLNIGGIYDCVIGCCDAGFVVGFSILDLFVGLPLFFLITSLLIFTTTFVFCVCFCFVIFGLIFF